MEAARGWMAVCPSSVEGSSATLAAAVNIVTVDWPSRPDLGKLCSEPNIIDKRFRILLDPYLDPKHKLEIGSQKILLTIWL